MTDKGLIRTLRMLHDADFTPGIYEHSVYGRAATLLEALLEENERLKAGSRGVSVHERLIDADALMDAIENLDWYQPAGKGKLSCGAPSEGAAVYKAADIFHLVNATPSVDAVPVVRCGSCEYAGEIDDSFCRKLWRGFSVENEDGFVATVKGGVTVD